jgi:hypothetical protein
LESQELQTGLALYLIEDRILTMTFRFHPLSHAG